MSELRIRQPLSAGTWYKHEATALQTEIQGYLNHAPPKPDTGDLIGLVVPHAGHIYSGHVAGSAFAWLAPGAFETVVLIGPDHMGITLEQIASLDIDVWRTPLGDIPIARDFLQTVQSNIDLKLVSIEDEHRHSLGFMPRRYEHSLEVELPFLQMTLEQFKLAPFMMGNQSPSTYHQLADALVKAINTNQFGPTLLVASSDLSHFFDDHTARRLDKDTIQFMLDLDGDGLAQYAQGCSRGEGACGAGPVATIIHAAKALGADQAHLLKYATSGDVHPRKDSVVGYAAVAFSK